MGRGLWDFSINLEDWPITKGMGKSEIIVEFGKGLIWVLDEILEKKKNAGNGRNGCE